MSSSFVSVLVDVVTGDGDDEEEEIGGDEDDEEEEIGGDEDEIAVSFTFSSFNSPFTSRSTDSLFIWVELFISSNSSLSFTSSTWFVPTKEFDSFS